MDPLTIISLVVVLGGAALQRYLREDAPPKKLLGEVRIPRTDEGTSAPLVFGKCRVRSPVLAWIGDVHTTASSGLDFAQYGFIQDDTPLVRASFLMLLGIPFANGVNRLHAVYVGDTRLTNTVGTPTLEDSEGTGEYELGPDANDYPGFTSSFVPGASGVIAGGRIEFLNGNDAQRVVNGSTPTTMLAERRIDLGGDASRIPAYRGYMSAFMFGALGTNFAGVNLGTTPQVPVFGFEVSSYPPFNGEYFAGFYGSVMIGDDANPAHVIASILIDEFGKYGLGLGILDGQTFASAATTLAVEGAGYSRAVEDRAGGTDVLLDILRQIAGVLYVNPNTGLFVLKLIRPDYDPGAILTIWPENCERIEDYTIVGASNLPNLVRVIFEDRAEGYADNSAAAMNQANSIDQDGLVNEVTIRMMGVKTATQAKSIAARELAAISFPRKSCRAIVDRTFWDTFPASVVRLNWPAYHASNVIMRVAAADRGPPHSNTITLTLIEDTSFVYRNTIIEQQLEPFPGSGGLLVF